MSSPTGTETSGFRLSMLINDTRYRSLTFQAIALIALIFAIGYLVSNLFSNLSQAGLNIKWGFFTDTAGYDINQMPIAYDNQMSHGRASMVGAVNTLIVAFLACVSATVLGVAAGVFRNVPVLIWILIIFLVMSNLLPQPREFRGDAATSSMWFDMVAFTNRGIYVPSLIMGSGAWTVILTFLASIAGVIWFRRHATKVLFDTGRMISTFLPSIGVLIVPTVLMFFILGSPIGLEYPELKGFNFKGGLHLRLSLIALWFALAIYTGAFIAENVRAGIQAISSGQTEAAAALGLWPGKVMSLIVLPQALRVIVPPLISQYLNITKNSSLAIAVGYMDITGTLGGITLNQTGRAIECILILMLFYLVISLSISAIMNIYNNTMKLQER
jgi:general L-amino acid transport system permease protein